MICVDSMDGYIGDWEIESPTVYGLQLASKLYREREKLWISDSWTHACCKPSRQRRSSKAVKTALLGFILRCCQDSFHRESYSLQIAALINLFPRRITVIISMPNTFYVNCWLWIIHPEREEKYYGQIRAQLTSVFPYSPSSEKKFLRGGWGLFSHPPKSYAALSSMSNQEVFVKF